MSFVAKKRKRNEKSVLIRKYSKTRESHAKLESGNSFYDSFFKSLTSGNAKEDSSVQNGPHIQSPVKKTLQTKRPDPYFKIKQQVAKRDGIAKVKASLLERDGEINKERKKISRRMQSRNKNGQIVLRNHIQHVVHRLS
jgi:hypothetical protein